MFVIGGGVVSALCLLLLMFVRNCASYYLSMPRPLRTILPKRRVGPNRSLLRAGRRDYYPRLQGSDVSLYGAARIRHLDRHL